MRTGSDARLYDMHGKALTKAREKVGMNRADFAVRLVVSRQYVSMVEKGAEIPSEQRAAQIADVLEKAGRIKKLAEAIWAEKKK